MEVILLFKWRTSSSDFVLQNELFCGNLTFHQKLNTHCRSNVTSCIDHVFFPKYASDNILSCHRIIYNKPDVVSDHFPLKTMVSIGMSVVPDGDN